METRFKPSALEGLSWPLTTFGSTEKEAIILAVPAYLLRHGDHWQKHFDPDHFIDSFKSLRWGKYGALLSVVYTFTKPYIVHNMLALINDGYFEFLPAQRSIRVTPKLLKFYKAQLDRKTENAKT